MVQNGSKTYHLEHLVSLGPEMLQNDGVPGVFKYTLRFSAFQASFNDPLRGFGAFLVSFNEPLRGFGTFQVSFNDPLRGLTAFQVSFNDPLRGFEAFQASFNDPPRGNPRQGPFNQPLRRVGALSNPYEGASQLARTDCHRRGWLK